MPVVLLAGCAGNVSALDPAGPAAAAIAQLWWAMLAGSVILFALVMGLFALVMLRPVAGARVSPRAWIILGGLGLPVPVLTILVAYALFQGERLLPGEGAGLPAMRIEARARQWEWEFRYPDEPGMPATFDVLHIPSDTPIDVVAVSEDVIHSFWVPSLGGKIDATPGHAARMRLQADRTGSYGGLCAEYCGTGHAGMRFRVEVHDREVFPSVLAREAAE